MGAQNSVLSAADQKQQSLAAIGFHGTLLQSSTFFKLKLLIDLYVVNPSGHVEMH